MAAEEKEKEKSKEPISKEFSDTFVGFVVAAFTLVAGLAWNEAIKELFNQFFGERSGLISLFGYAIVVTIVATLVARRFGRKIKK